MSNEPDVLGLASLAWLADPSQDDLVIERDDGTVSHDTIGHYFYRGTNSFKGYQNGLFRYIREPILDLGCGAGRFYTHLTVNGFRVVGIDTSNGVLKACANNTPKASTLVQMSINALGLAQRTFNTVLVMGHSLGAVGDSAGLGRLLDNLHVICTEDGCILVTSVDVDKLPIEADRAYHAANALRQHDVGYERMRLRWNTITGRWFDWLFIGPNDLGAIAARHGWRVQEVIHDESRPDRYAAALTMS